MLGSDSGTFARTYHPGVDNTRIQPHKFKRQEEAKFKKELGNLQVVCCMLEDLSQESPSYNAVFQECEAKITLLNGKDGVQEKFTKWYLKVSNEEQVDEKAKDQVAVLISP